MYASKKSKFIIIKVSEFSYTRDNVVALHGETFASISPIKLQEHRPADTKINNRF